MKLTCVFLLLAGQASALPHLIFNLIDDFGWANVGYHRPVGFNETQTPNMDSLVASGVLFDQYYAHQYCSPSRSSYQTGRMPIHVNVLNDDEAVWNPADPVSGFAAVPRNMTGIASKLKQAGYATALFGKWDCGMATPDHTPKGRGYDSSLHYFHHANDYWSSVAGNCPVPSGGNQTYGVVDLWQNANGVEGPARGLNNTKNCTQAHQDGCKYEDEIFAEGVLSLIEAHDPSTPLFLFWAPHNIHAPLEVPQAFLDKFAFIHDSQRQYYAAMVNFIDTQIGRVVAALKAKGMWENLLWMSSSDNGGPIYNSGAAGANNFPLRGGKMSNWQGGIRVNAYASGGFLPAAVRGTTAQGLIETADMYTTFCAIAGVDATDGRAAAAGLPAVDGFNMWPMISGANLTSPRTEVPIGANASEVNLQGYFNGTVVQGIVSTAGPAGGLWKLLVGEVPQNIWTGPQYPNQSTSWVDQPERCGIPMVPVVGKGGCLFNLLDDPTEHNDVAAAHPDIVAALYERVEHWQGSVFSPNRGADDGSACRAATQTWGGFYGPFTA